MARNWDEELDPRLSLDVLRSLATTVFLPRVMGPARDSLAASLRLGHIDAHLELVAGWEPDYGVYTSRRGSDHYSREWMLRSLRAERQIPALFSKQTFGSADRKAVAVRAFLDSETRCRETNHLITQARKGHASLLGRTPALLHEAKRLVAHVLGEAPDIAQLMRDPGKLGFRLGKGATAYVRRRDASPAVKLGQPLTCAAPLLSSLGAVLSGAPFLIPMHALAKGPVREGESLDVHITNALWDSVKKNYRTERGICKEPDLNVPVQGVIGRLMAAKLYRRAGLDIRDQTRNQQLALLASISGDVATLDLKSASDLISREIVAELLPLDWFVLLERARSSRCTMPDGSVITLEKFSSMGNGFTFPLETLIFWALTSAVCGTQSVSVYGDDIVCPREGYDDVVSLLEACGFAVNLAKSYSSLEVRFRESCGKDYFFGDDVRPAYVRGNLSDRRLTALHNFFARAADFEAAAAVRQYISKGNVLYGPDGLGDGHLLVTPDSPRVSYQPFSREKGYSGYTFKSHVAKPKWVDLPVVPVESSMAAVLYDVERRARTPLFRGLPNRNPLVVLDDASSIRHRKDGQLEISLAGGQEEDETGTLVYNVRRIVVESVACEDQFDRKIEVHAGRLWSVTLQTGEKPRYVLLKD